MTQTFPMWYWRSRKLDGEVLIYSDSLGIAEYDPPVSLSILWAQPVEKNNNPPDPDRIPRIPVHWQKNVKFFSIAKTGKTSTQLTPKYRDKILAQETPPPPRKREKAVCPTESSAPTRLLYPGFGESYQKPLECPADMQASGRNRGVRMKDTVEVMEIPSYDEYGPEDHEILWTKTDAVKVHRKRSFWEWKAKGKNWRTCIEEPVMYMLDGKLVHTWNVQYREHVVKEMKSKKNQKMRKKKMRVLRKTSTEDRFAPTESTVKFSSRVRSFLSSVRSFWSPGHVRS